MSCGTFGGLTRAPEVFWTVCERCGALGPRIERTTVTKPFKTLCCGLPIHGTTRPFAADFALGRIGCDCSTIRTEIDGVVF